MGIRVFGVRETPEARRDRLVAEAGPAAHREHRRAFFAFADTSAETGPDVPAGRAWACFDEGFERLAPKSASRLLVLLDLLDEAFGDDLLAEQEAAWREQGLDRTAGQRRTNFRLGPGARGHRVALRRGQHVRPPYAGAELSLMSKLTDRRFGFGMPQREAAQVANELLAWFDLTRWRVRRGTAQPSAIRGRWQRYLRSHQR